MSRSLRDRALYALSMLFAAAPFVVALFRALGLGLHHDLRFLWMALAAFIGEVVVMAIGKARTRPPAAVLALAPVALVVATVLAAAAGFLSGARAAPGVWLVALTFALFFAASHVVGAYSRPPVRA